MAGLDSWYVNEVLGSGNLTGEPGVYAIDKFLYENVMEAEGLFSNEDFAYNRSIAKASMELYYSLDGCKERQAIVTKATLDDL
jgi:hypothetical protein